MIINKPKNKKYLICHRRQAPAQFNKYQQTKKCANANEIYFSNIYKKRRRHYFGNQRYANWLMTIQGAMDLKPPNTPKTNTNPSNNVRKMENGTILVETLNVD